jgi:adenylate cyclase
MLVFRNLKQHLFAIFLVIAGFLLADSDAVQIQGMKFLDWQRQIAGQTKPSNEKIIVIGVDQYSLDNMEKQQAIGWPWPREFYGGMAEYAASAGAKAVLIDILFNNETPYGSASDDEFANRITNAANVYLAAALTNTLSSQNAFQGLPFSGIAPAGSDFHGISLPLEKIASAAAGLGLVNSKPDPDGTFRRINPFFIWNGSALPLLSVAPFVDKQSSIEWQTDSILVGDRRIPIDHEGKMWINFPVDDYLQRFSAYDVINAMITEQSGEQPAIPKTVFKDAYVLIGYLAPGLYDLKPTPFSARSSGVEVHSAVLNSWLTREFLTPLKNWHSATLGLLFAMLIYITYLWLNRAVYAVSFNLLILLSSLMVSLLLIRFNMIPSLPLLFLPAIMISLGIGARRFLAESREKEFRQKSLERMVSPNVAQWLLENPERRMQRTGEMRSISVFFSDLAGFTTLAETLGPEKTVRIINQYMDMMQSVILKHDGTIKQFVGDAVMAIWGAPKSQQDQVVLAIKTALESQQLLDNTIFDYGDNQSTRLSMRIGIDHGECIVGNIGSSQRFEYAAVGDTVNRAARLEGLNKFYSTRIIISESAWQEAGHAFFGRKLDEVQVKGKHFSVGIFEPMAILGQENEKQRFIADNYTSAWQHYARGQWRESRKHIETILAKYDDGPASLILDRITQIESDPAIIGEDWNGIWKFTSK